MLWVEAMVPDENCGGMVGNRKASAHVRGRSGPEGPVISCLIQGVKTVKFPDILYTLSLDILYSAGFSCQPSPTAVETLVGEVDFAD